MVAEAGIADLLFSNWSSGWESLYRFPEYTGPVLRGTVVSGHGTGATGSMIFTDGTN